MKSLTQLWNNRAIQSAMDAELRMAYCLAGATNRITIGKEWYEPDALKNPKIITFMDKVKIKI